MNGCEEVELRLPLQHDILLFINKPHVIHLSIYSCMYCVETLMKQVPGVTAVNSRFSLQSLFFILS